MGIEAAESLAALPCLGRLDSLELHCCWGLPTWMPQLRHLTSLDLDGSPESDLAGQPDRALAAALGALPQLRELR